MVPKSISLRSIWLPLFLLAHVAFASPQNSQLRLGVLLDAGVPEILETLEQTKVELQKLLRTTTSVSIYKQLTSDWSPQKARAHYQELVADPNVDAILSLGVISSSILPKVAQHPKPVVALGVFDPLLESEASLNGNATGIKNLSFVLLNAPMKNDLEFFREVVSFKKVAAVFSQGFSEIFNTSQTLSSLSLGDPAYQVDLVLASQDVAQTLALLAEDVDAVYLGFIPDYSDLQMSQLLKGINQKKLPSFVWNLELLAMGGMVTNATETDQQKLARRIALNFESILSGADAGSLPMLLDFEPRMTINIATVREIQYSLSWDVLTEADVIQEDKRFTDRLIDLKTVMEEARIRSLDNAIAQRDLAARKQDVALAKGQLGPFLDWNATATQIDSDRAKMSAGSRAETTFSSGLRVQQLLYSERARAAVSLQQLGVDATQFQTDQIYLDVTQNAGLAYLDVLRAQALMLIRKQDLQQTRRNLELAKQRQTTGYSGRADVFRWESQLATANQEIIEARVNYFLAQSQLNRLLNRPQDTEFNLKEEMDREESKLTQFYETGFSSYLATPDDVEVLIAFLVEVSRELLPEIAALDASISAQKRQLLSDQRRRYVPEVALQGQADYLLSRSGEGSDDALPAAPEDLSWSAGVNVGLPLFQGGTLKRQVAKSRIELDRLEVQRRDLLQALELAIRFKMGALISTHFNLASSRKAADLAGKSLELVADGYQRGSSPIAQLLDAQVAATNSREAAAIAKLDFLSAILELERSVGSFTLFDSAEERAAQLQRFLNYSKNQLATNKPGQ